MQLLLIVAVLATLMISECGPSEPVSGGLGRLALAGGGVALVAALAAAISGVTARRLGAGGPGREAVLRQYRRLQRLHTAVWLMTVGGISYGLGWARLVRFNWGLDGTILVDELLILAPALLPVVLSWAAFYEVDRVIWLGQSGGVGAAGGLPRRGQYLVFHVRHYLGILLVPLLGLLTVQDVLELTAVGAAGHVYYGPVLLGSLVAVFVLFPVLLRYVWQTRPLPPGPLRRRLEEAAGRSGFGARDILVWHTDGMVVNAAVSGLVGRLRYVFLTDGLLLRLGDEEIEAVFGHEVGHVRHHHLLLRVLAMVAPVSLWMLLGQAFPEALGSVSIWREGAGSVAGALGTGIPAALGMLGGMTFYAVVVFGYYSRQLEHQADLFGCRWVGSEPGRSAVERFTAALERLASSSGSGRRRRSWQHASIGRRIDFLNRLSRDPKRELRFQRRVRLLGSLLIGSVLSPIVYELLLG